MKPEFTPIGLIHSPHKEQKGTPIQPHLAEGVEGTVELYQEFAPGLRDLEGFERIWLLCWLDRVCQFRLEVVPYLDTQTHGVFATRAPSRPNSIGLSCVRLLTVEGARLRVADLDILDGTTLLDIKTNVPDLDVFEVRRVGWYAHAGRSRQADNRFAQHSIDKPK